MSTRADTRRVGPLRSGAFRLAALFAGVFALASALLLLTVHRQVSAYADAATDGMLRNEIVGLTGEYRQSKLAGLVSAIERHRQAGLEAQFRYLLLDRRDRRLAGDLPLAAGRLGWGRMRDDQPDREDPGGGAETLKRLGVRLPEGMRLVAATDTFDIEQLGTRLARVTLWCGIGITLLAMAGGYVVGGIFLRRLDRVNDAVGRIMEGRSEERLPPIGMSAEFDRLSVNLNLMLDRNAALMQGLRQVTTDIAHDLRTPLNRLHQQLERARDHAIRTPDRAAFDSALAHTNQILAIFQALLRIGTIEGGAGRARFGPVDIGEVVTRVHGAFHAVAEDRGQELTVEVSPVSVVTGDATLLTQLVTNVVENALVHTPAGTKATVRVRSGQQGVVLEIIDSGSGVPAAEREKISQRFYRHDSSRNTPGAGLGLALVAAIAALHEARLSFHDAAPGLSVRLDFAHAR